MNVSTTLLTCIGSLGLAWGAENVDLSGATLPVEPGQRAEQPEPGRGAPEEARAAEAPPTAAELADAGAYAREGLNLMQASDEKPGLVVDAAVNFLMARAIYSRAGDHEAVRGLNANLFWCKKRMTNDDLDRYQAQVNRNPRLQEYHQAYEVAEAKVDTSQADTYLADAKTYANQHPQEHYQVAIRYFEVAERFAGSKAAVEAQRLSLQAFEAYMQYQQLQQQAERATVFQRPMDYEPGTMVIPDEDAIKDAVDELEVLFKQEYRAARRDPEKRALARQLLGKAKATQHDPVIKWAMLSEGLELAQDAKDPWLVLTIVDEQARSYQGIDPEALKIEALKEVRDSTAKAMITLLENPDDPEANTDAGKFVCFVSRRWDEGFKMLLAGNDEGLRRVAEMEMAKNKDTTEFMQLADAWYEASDDMRRDKEFMYGAMARAHTYYGKAMKGLEGISRNRVEKKLAELAKKLPLEYQEIDWDNLTVDQWDKIKGKTVVVDAKLFKTRTDINLAAGQKVRLVPHPTDTWSFRDTWDNGADQCTGYGSEKMRTFSTFSMLGTPRSDRLKMGEVCASVGDSDGFQARGQVEGPGLLYIRPYVGSYNSYIGEGKIRVKVITRDD